MHNPSFIGLDTGKHSLVMAGADVPLGSFDNDPKGIKRLIATVKKQHPKAVIMEPSGAYGHDVLTALLDAHITVLIAPTHKVRKFVQSLGWEKTDTNDAKAMARMGQTHLLRQAKLPDEKLVQLLQWTRRMAGLTEQKVSLQLQFEANPVPGIKKQIKAQLNQVMRQLKAAAKHRDDIVASMPAIAHAIEQMNRIKGVGRDTAVMVMAEAIVHGPFGSKKGFARYVGCTPQRFQSGTSVNRWASIPVTCNRSLRSRLFMPTLSAKVHNPKVRQHYNRVLSNKIKEGRRGPKKIANIAAMRVFVEQIYDTMINALDHYENTQNTLTSN